MRKLGIVIVNYNGAKFQNACVDSILQSDYDDFYIADKKECQEQVKMAVEFLYKAKAFINNSN